MSIKKLLLWKFLLNFFLYGFSFFLLFDLNKEMQIGIHLQKSAILNYENSQTLSNKQQRLSLSQDNKISK